MKKKILSLVLALAMVVSLFPGMSITADAEGGGVTELSSFEVNIDLDKLILPGDCTTENYMHPADAFSFEPEGLFATSDSMRVWIHVNGGGECLVGQCGHTLSDDEQVFLFVQATLNENYQFTDGDPEVILTGDAADVGTVEEIYYNEEYGMVVLVVKLGDNGTKAEVDALLSGSEGGDNVSVTSVTLNKSNTELTVGNTETLTATVLPENATNKAVTWSSSDPSVATVANGVVTAMAVGTTTITATAADGSGVRATCGVVVTADQSGGGGTPKLGSITVSFPQNYTFDKIENKATLPDLASLVGMGALSAEVQDENGDQIQVWGEHCNARWMYAPKNTLIVQYAEDGHTANTDDNIYLIEIAVASDPYLVDKDTITIGSQEGTGIFLNSGAAKPYYCYSYDFMALSAEETRNYFTAIIMPAPDDTGDGNGNGGGDNNPVEPPSVSDGIVSGIAVTINWGNIAYNEEGYPELDNDDFTLAPSNVFDRDRSWYDWMYYDVELGYWCTVDDFSSLSDGTQLGIFVEEELLSEYMFSEYASAMCGDYNIVEDESGFSQYDVGLLINVGTKSQVVPLIGSTPIPPAIDPIPPVILPPVGGSTGGSNNSENVTTGSNTETPVPTTETTAKPSVSGAGSNPTATVTDKMGNTIVDQAKENNSDTVVIAPEFNGSDDSASVVIPTKTVNELGRETNADLVVETPVATVTFGNSDLTTLGQPGGNVVITTEKVPGGMALDVTVNGQSMPSIPGGVLVNIPEENLTPGTVAMIVHEDGTRELVRKSVADVPDQTMFVPLEGSATVIIVDNAQKFDDVQERNWFSDAVAFASGHELFRGISATEFGPNVSTTRGMLATVIYRMENEPNFTGNDLFGDMSGKEYYAEAAAWAASKGIVTGYSANEFGGDDAITREQLATMLWRYVGTPMSYHSVSRFNDADEISSYAEIAVAWANEMGIMNGRNGVVLDPKGEATRAEVAQMLMNFMALIAN